MKKLLLIPVLLLFSSSWSSAQSSVEPPGGMAEIEAYSIFLENLRNDSYESAIEFGRWIWVGMPETIENYPKFNLERNLERLIEAYGGRSEQIQDPTVREAYLDTALTIYDKVFEKYSADQIDYYDWHMNRGRFFQSHSDYIDNAMNKAAADYLEAFNLKPEEFTKNGEGYYMQVMIQNMVSNGEKDKVLALLKETESFAPTKLKNYYDKVRNQLFDSPKERITFLEGQLEDNPGDVEILTQLRELYRGQDMVDKAQKISQKLYDIDPTYENTMALADIAISNANYNTAIKYLKEALNKTEENQQKAQIALKISDAYLNQDELQTAREFARDATEYDSEWGEPYIQIADIYAQTVGQCTNNRKLVEKDKTVYWLVLDYLDRARQVDSSTTSEVERKYKSYNPVTPTTEEKFFWNPPLEEGDEFVIDGSLMECYGWINETTAVR